MSKENCWILDDSSLEPYKVESVESKKQEDSTSEKKEEESENVQKSKKL